MKTIYKDVVNQVIFLYEGYSKEHRASTQPFHLQKVQQLIKNYKYDCKDFLIREPLIEHSGSLPIVATTIYPYINNPDVDLGRALVMLAIHDIGELTTGDEITFTKTSDKGVSEREEALKLLPESFHDIYLEIEGRTSDTARFAKAIDKITPDFVDLMTPAEITIDRMKIFANTKPTQIVPVIKKFKHPYMVWNPFMKKLHLELLRQLDKKLKPFYKPA